MLVRRLDHVQLAMPTSREDEAVAVYDDALSIPPVPKPPHLATRGGCWFDCPAPSALGSVARGVPP